MRCSEVVRILHDLQISRDPSEAVAASPGDDAVMDALLQGGYVERLSGEQFDPDQLAAKRSRFFELSAAFDAGEMTPEAYDKASTALRSEILDLTAAAARFRGSVDHRGGRLALTYKGQSLLDAISTRMSRVEGMELAEFEREMEALRASLAARAQK